MRAVAGSAEVPETGLRPPALPTRNSAPAADVVVIAEASTPHETGIARERARHVAHAADYESAINGNPLTSAFYLVTSAADRSSGAFPAIVGWAQRRPDS
ncbi:hypothetical protein [Gordonia amicalis]|uniref:hypothetical protein n=1 Tax=Gordonia amicalis TaxID=89053 RepID=UPI0002A651A5|nr:hypothetical protein [Gordonia amicalis]MDV7099851.1 hypothetical protein [Gordonia amicalis]MDV7174335.1 hypothetical protein [Gordonia amicalis]GAC52535.1 hypothetical protein GOAMI_13_00840 [Gordonia amicalis NBRC 100051 = JCM 11271]